MERRHVFRRLWQASVWARDSVPTVDWRYRGIYRFVLPLTDLFFCYFGVVGWAKGVPSVQQAAGHEYAAAWSAAIAIAAFVALIGVSIPRLWLLEMIAKVVLVGAVFLYVFLYLQRIITDFSASAATGLVLILILLPMWRLSDLSVIAWKHGLGRRRRGGGDGE